MTCAVTHATRDFTSTITVRALPGLRDKDGSAHVVFFKDDASGTMGFVILLTDNPDFAITDVFERKPFRTRRLPCVAV